MWFHNGLFGRDAAGWSSSSCMASDLPEVLVIGEHFAVLFCGLCVSSRSKFIFCTGLDSLLISAVEEFNDRSTLQKFLG